MCFGGGLGLFERGFGGLHPGFEGVELGLADALDGKTQRALLADDQLVLGLVPALLAKLGEATNSDRFTAGIHRAAGGLNFPFENNLRFETDAGWYCVGPSASSAL